ncbi:MAG: hypothetical protein EB830_05970 [Nitrosopumilus sp. H13]|nr:MAG: hypothetical protein EB830_05970 [Nitrosopumilus sp. H13]
MAKKKEEIPDWVSKEIQNAKFGGPAEIKKTGYILELYEDDGKMEVQLYDSIEDGRHIVEMGVPKKIKTGDLERGVVYEFVFDQMVAPLSKEVTEYLATEKGMEMSAMYQFELKSLELLDVDSGEAAKED